MIMASTTISMSPSAVTLNSSKRQSKTREAIFDTLRSFQRRVSPGRADGHNKENSPSTPRNGKDWKTQSPLASSTNRRQPLQAQETNRQHQAQSSIFANSTLDQNCIVTDSPARTSSDVRSPAKERINTLALDSLYSQVILPGSLASRRPNSSAGTGRCMERITELTDTRPPSAYGSLSPRQRSQRRRSVPVGPHQIPAMTRSTTLTALEHFTSVPSLMVSSDSSHTVYYGDAGAFDIVNATQTPLSNGQSQGHDRRSFDVVQRRVENQSNESSIIDPDTSIQSRQSKRKAVYFKDKTSSIPIKVDDEAVVDLANSLASSSISARIPTKRQSSLQRSEIPPPHYSEMFSSPGRNKCTTLE